jgi:hypothetical protein
MSGFLELAAQLELTPGITNDRRRAQHDALSVQDRRDPTGHRKDVSRPVDPHSFQRGRLPVALQRAQHPLKLTTPVLRQQHLSRLAEHLRLGPSVQRLAAAVPHDDTARRVEDHDRVAGTGQRRQRQPRHVLRLLIRLGLRVRFDRLLGHALPALPRRHRHRNGAETSVMP